jgi:hypothetical protein
VVTVYGTGTSRAVFYSKAYDIGPVLIVLPFLLLSLALLLQLLSEALKKLQRDARVAELFNAVITTTACPEMLPIKQDSEVEC